MSLITFLLSLSLCFCSLTSILASTATEETTALLSFKQYSVSSDPSARLVSWAPPNSSTDVSPCNWAGVTCSNTSRRVQSIDLSQMGLSGKLNLDPLFTLSSLQQLDLHGNSFYGNLSYTSHSTTPCSLVSVDLSANLFNETVPNSFLATCTNLVSVNLSRNSIFGGIFPFGSSLRVLDLSRNKISDSNLLNFSLSGCHGLSYLNLSDNRLAGRLTEPGPCTNFTVLDLSNNQFSGEIPPSFISGLPESLSQLDLSHNNFSGDFSGYDLGSCGNLISMDLSFNILNGSGLPLSLSNCHQLQQLDFSGNHFSGEIPNFWANLTNLKTLALSNNEFSGSIPPTLGQLCGSILSLDLSGNRLIGGLPSTFIACSSLQSLDLSDNQLSGDFTDKIISTISPLKTLKLGFNNITGPNPLLSLSSCKSLQLIDLSSNELTGEIPTGICSYFPLLKRLFLPNNYLSGIVPPQIGNCSNLLAIDLSFNNLGGIIPRELYLNPNLIDLVMWANNFSGEIPDILCLNGIALETLVISYNALTGSIPPSLTKCLNLAWVSLAGNQLVGPLPKGLGNLKNLAIFQLNKNYLSGEVPGELGSCKNLIWLDLNSNNLSGPVPGSIAAQAGLVMPGIVSGKQFAFLRNEAGNICPGAGVLFEFFGIRPERLAGFPLVHSCPSTRIYTGMAVYTFTSNGSMIFLDLSYNRLSGEIPETLGSMGYLQVLNLGHNELTGTIPESFARLKSIGALDLSHNHLTGPIPAGLGTLNFLADFDVSDNNLTGPIPTSGQLTTFPASRYANNSGLCGVPLPPCGQNPNLNPNGTHQYTNERKKVWGASILIGVGLSVLIILSLLLALYKLKRDQKKSEKAEARANGYINSLPTSGMSSWKLSGAREPLSINVATFEKPLRKLTFAHLLEATNGFGPDSLIGSGGFGEVYKARLKDGSSVAVKKLIHFTGQGDREFMAEMETIGKIKHRNLVPLLGYCKIGDERLLVYEYMKFGSLDVVLHDESWANGVILDWAARKKIAIGSARGLAFLHHSCIPHIIHRDMKSSNVLLDENLEARVSDFGMARLMNALDTHLSVSTLAGTPGYVPPEYYQSFRCTTKGDVYSFGVILLELLSGKKPIDPVEFGDNNLVGWVKQLVKENRCSEIFDPVLLGNNSGSREGEMYQYLKIALECLDDRPMRRPTMIQVMAMFKGTQGETDSDFLDGFSVGGTVIDESGEKAV